MTMKKLLKLFESEQVAEKAVSQQQQKFMGMVHAMQKGEEVKGASPELEKVAKTMGKKDAKDFASTKHKGLPKTVTEDVMLDEGGNALKHIANRFKHEVKNFMSSGFMADDLYDALVDYYYDIGEIPYGVLKGREGDPQQWVEERFYADMGSGMSESMVIKEPVDNTLSELARLAGLPTNEDGPGASMLYSKDKPESMTNKMKSGADSVKDFFKQGAEAYKDQYMTGLGMPPDKYTPADPRKPFGPKKSEVDEDGPGAALLYSKDKPDSFGDKLKSAGKSIRQAIDKATLPAGMHADYDRIEAEKDKREADTKSKTLGECGDMGMDRHDTMNVSTNMSSDGTKNVTISAQGDKADELLQMLKMAGMQPHDDHSVTMSEPEVIMIGRNDEMMEEELEEVKKRTTKYSNTPEEEYETVEKITTQGNDLNRQKRQYADKPRLGDNPMAESVLDADLNSMLESILVREEPMPPYDALQNPSMSPSKKSSGQANKPRGSIGTPPIPEPQSNNNEPYGMRTDPETGRVHMSFPPAPGPARKLYPPSQSEFPLQTEPYGGPRQLSTEPEKTGTEKDDDSKIYEEGFLDTISNTIGDIVGTESSALRRSEQLRQLDAMRKQYKGTEWEPQVQDRYQKHLSRIQADRGDIVDYDPKTGRETLRPVVPPEQWKGGK